MGSDKKNDTWYTEKDRDHILSRFACKAVYIDDKFSKPVVLYRDENAACKFLDTILEEYDYC